MIKEIICKNCNKLFKDKLYKKNRTFCSKECFSLFRRNNPKEYSGNKSYAWKGGKRFHKGYILIYAPNHLYKIQRFYIKEHRYIMEQHLGRFLKKEEVVHHINGIKTDNRIENLHLFKNHSEHMNHCHQSKKPHSI